MQKTSVLEAADRQQCDLSCAQRARWLFPFFFVQTDVRELCFLRPDLVAAPAAAVALVFVLLRAEAKTAFPSAR